MIMPYSSLLRILLYLINNESKINKCHFDIAKHLFRDKNKKNEIIALK